MHGAHNTAYRNITTELNTCIDSDDWMPDDAVEKIITLWKANGSDSYAGMIGLDQREDGSIIGDSFNKSDKDIKLLNFYANGGSGDKKIVYRTELIKQYPEYPLFDGERYVGLAYKQMLMEYDGHLFLTYNEPLVTVEYQPDGSSNSMYRQYWNNPRGFAFFRKTEMVVAPRLKRRFVSAVHYVSHSLRAKNGRFLGESPKKGLTLLAVLPGFALYLYTRHKVLSGKKMNIK